MTHKETASLIAKTLRRKLEGLRTVMTVGHYKFSKCYHYEFMLKDTTKQSATLVIFSEEDGKFKLWNIYNFYASLSMWLIRDITETIELLNKKRED